MNAEMLKAFAESLSAYRLPRYVSYWIYPHVDLDKGWDSVSDFPHWRSHPNTTAKEFTAPVKATLTPPYLGRTEKHWKPSVLRPILIAPNDSRSKMYCQSTHAYTRPFFCDNGNRGFRKQCYDALSRDSWRFERAFDMHVNIYYALIQEPLQVPRHVLKSMDRVPFFLSCCCIFANLSWVRMQREGTKKKKKIG